MSSTPVRLHTWLRLQREQVALSARADALCRALRGCAGVRQAYYLNWQAGAGIYAHEGSEAHLPPGQGDPLQASDSLLHERLQSSGVLDLTQVRALDCWLAGRLRRAGIDQGAVLALALDETGSGLLLVVTREGAALPWLGWMRELLASLLACAGGLSRSSPLLGLDPQPSLLLDAKARPLELNAALLALLADQPMDELLHFLPVNHAALVDACLAQRRAIEAVEAEYGERILIWTFIPDPQQARVLARCREATAQVLAEREASRARRLYRLITENTTDLISRHAPDGRFLDASPAAWRLLGFWPEELRGQPVEGLLHPEDRVHLLARSREALEMNGYHTMTYRVRHRDGHYLWFETASHAIRETYTGAVVEVVSVSRDITARVQAEENRRRLSEVVEVNTDLVLFIDAEGRVTYLNPAARRTLCLPEGRMPALEALFDSEALEQLRGAGRAAAEREGVWSADARLLVQDVGASVPVSLVLLTHRTTGGERYYSLVARDMSERELREAQQRRHQEELAHTGRLVTLGELASGIAHEINQPLAAVVNYASASQRYLQSLGDNPQAVERVAQGLERITEHANHASEVIKRLRAFLRKGQRLVQPLDVGEVARDAVRLCAWETAAAQVTVEQRLAADLPPVCADRVLLEQVLINLLRNAIEANREAHLGRPSRIVLRARHEAGELLLDVQDQGAGLDERELEQAFTPFFTRKPDGLGLGLPMSRSIIEGFGGALEGRPGEEGGLCMRCRLPVKTITTTEEQ
ncbi:PAS domain-containing sensor histidine kinase [Stutzerimonas stutzeri]|uniref:PAS domain-containing sensor histidine kinase n=1 Tax=Stutzerimonas stutzeri TaxID=316 RepID=UPI0015E47DBE|nr:PAS domain S-box protein [Stutzerimonas stutzeri]MBA1264466.1 PAS domain S-box protein [Stutzerimonas stutzeri]